jgi:hypothetical protein
MDEIECRNLFLAALLTSNILVEKIFRQVIRICPERNEDAQSFGAKQRSRHPCEYQRRPPVHQGIVS